jgi:hypothetical protein
MMWEEVMQDGNGIMMDAWRRRGEGKKVSWSRRLTKIQPAKIINAYPGLDVRSRVPAGVARDDALRVDATGDVHASALRLHVVLPVPSARVDERGAVGKAFGVVAAGETAGCVTGIVAFSLGAGKADADAWVLQD